MLGFGEIGALIHDKAGICAAARQFAIPEGKEEEGSAFLKKSAQKTSDSSGPRWFQRPRPRFKKVFAPLPAEGLFSKSAAYLPWLGVSFFLLYQSGR
jgi:hypothetical protein